MTTQGRKLKSYPGVYYLGNGEYQLRITAKCPLTGKMRERSKTIAAEDAQTAGAEAEAMRRALKEELEIPKPQRTELFADYLERWLKHLKDTGRRRNVDRERSTINNWITPILGQVRVRDIGVPHLQHWMTEANKRRKPNGNDYSRSSRSTAWHILSDACKDFITLGVRDSDPAERLRYSPTGEADKKKAILTNAERLRVLKEADKECVAVQAALYLAFATGMRFGEFTALEIPDVDFEGECIIISKSQNLGVVGQTKTKKVREVWLDPISAEKVKAQIANIRKRGYTGNLLFPSKKDTYYTASWLNKPLTRIQKAAKIEKKLNTHTPRRTLNNLVRQHTPKQVLQAITGHSTDQMTYHYSDVDLSEKRDAVARALSPAEAATAVEPAGVEVEVEATEN